MVHTIEKCICLQREREIAFGLMPIEDHEQESKELGMKAMRGGIIREKLCEIT